MTRLHRDGPGPRSEAGAAGLVTILAAVVFGVGALTALVAVTDLAATAARAQVAADAAALAAAGTSPLVDPGGTTAPAEAARTVATANGVRLVDTDGAGWPLRFGATVEARPRTAWVRELVPPLRATAVAAVRPSSG